MTDVLRFRIEAMKTGRATPLPGAAPAPDRHAMEPAAVR